MKSEDMILLIQFKGKPLLLEEGLNKTQWSVLYCSYTAHAKQWEAQAQGRCVMGTTK